MQLLLRYESNDLYKNKKIVKMENLQSNQSNQNKQSNLEITISPNKVKMRYQMPNDFRYRSWHTFSSFGTIDHSNEFHRALSDELIVSKSYGLPSQKVDKLIADIMSHFVDECRTKDKFITEKISYSRRYNLEGYFGKDGILCLSKMIADLNKKFAVQD